MSQGAAKKAEEMAYCLDASEWDALTLAYSNIPNVLLHLIKFQLDLAPCHNLFNMKNLKLNFKVKAKFLFFILDGETTWLCLGTTHPITNSATSRAMKEQVRWTPEPTRTPPQEWKQWAPMPTLKSSVILDFSNINKDTATAPPPKKKRMKTVLGC